MWYQSCLGVHVEVRGQLWELILSLYHVGLRNWTEVLRYGNKCHYLWSHLAGPVISLGHQMNARRIPARPPEITKAIMLQFKCWKLLGSGMECSSKPI